MEQKTEERIRQLVGKFSMLRTKEGTEQFDKEFNSLLAELQPEQRREAGRILRDEMRNRREAVQERADVRGAMGELTQALNMSYIAREFFHKDRSWLSQKLNGNIVNGKPSAFTEEELATFRSALVNIQNRLSETISNI